MADRLRSGRLQGLSGEGQISGRSIAPLIGQDAPERSAQPPPSDWDERLGCDGRNVRLMWKVSVQVLWRTDPSDSTTLSIGMSHGIGKIVGITQSANPTPTTLGAGLRPHSVLS